MKTIHRIRGREILDSRGWPTLECWLELSDGQTVTASVPAGASKGKYEAQELRDHDERYQGRGVRKAIHNLEKNIGPMLIGKKPDLFELDKLIIEADGTHNKSNFGANAILAASIAVGSAQALSNGVEVFELIAQLCNRTPTIPRCMFNIINGGIHGDSGAKFQEFMIMPCKQASFEELLEEAVLVYQQLKVILRKRSYSTGVGDEGGFAPLLIGSGILKEREALDLLVESIIQAGFTSDQIKICLDVAASYFFDVQKNMYVIDDELFSSEDLIEMYEELATAYPLYSLEDGMGQDDWNGWQLLTEKLGTRLQLVGDDVFVTNKKFIEKGCIQGVANAVLIKPNQIGTVTEALDALEYARKSGYSVIASHRSGETIDSFIADFAVGAGADQFKAGACARGERVVKYNRLLEIEANAKL